MSPILVRPVREQLEHDRVIRLLQQDLQKRKVEVAINPGSEQNASVGSGVRKEFPDAVVYSLEKGKKVVAVVEVETGESVNHLEAMAQWAHLAKLRVPFHLYVPINSVDAARRLSHDYKISVTEIWSYHQVGEQFKFTLFHPAGASRGGKGATPPRTVSVATIRVAPAPEPEPPVVEEPPARTEPTPTPKPASRGHAAKTIPARVVTAAPTPVKPGGEGAGSGSACRPSQGTEQGGGCAGAGRSGKGQCRQVGPGEGQGPPPRSPPRRRQAAGGRKERTGTRSRPPAAKVAPVKAPPKSAPKPVTKLASQARRQATRQGLRNARPHPRPGRSRKPRALDRRRPPSRWPRNAVKPVAKRK